MNWHITKTPENKTLLDTYDIHIEFSQSELFNISMGKKFREAMKKVHESKELAPKLIALAYIANEIERTKSTYDARNGKPPPEKKEYDIIYIDEKIPDYLKGDTEEFRGQDFP